MDMQKKLLGHTYGTWAYVVGGGLVVGFLGKMIGLKGLGLSVTGAIAGYCMRGYQNGGYDAMKQKIIDLRQKAMAQTANPRVVSENGTSSNGIPLLEETANQFIVPDPSAAPAAGSEGAMAGYGRSGFDPVYSNIVQQGVVTRQVYQPGVVNQTPLRTR
jgi:hypothetical protein